MPTASELAKLKIESGDISSFFDCLTDILLKYSGGELTESQNFKKCFNPYMLCRYISMKPSLIVYAEYLNIVQSVLTYEQFYKLAYNIIPKQKAGYIKYIKKLQKKESVNDSDAEKTSGNINTRLFDL